MMRLIIILLAIWILLVPPTHPKTTNVFRKPAAEKQYPAGTAKFMRAVALMESEGKAHVVNKYGMMGKYQFAAKTLRELGFNVTNEEFLRNPALQDSAMMEFMRDNAKSLHTVIKEYSNTEYNGIKITKSGILAAAHLAGPGGVLAYFYPTNEKWNKYKTVDANGADVSMYLRKFSGYNIIL